MSDAPEEPETPELVAENDAVLAGTRALVAALGTPRDPNFGTPVINETGIPNATVARELARVDAAVLSSLSEWVQNTRPGYDAIKAQGTGAGVQRNGGLFYRDRYLTPTNPYDQMKVAAQATEQDDVVGTVAEVSESLMFSATSFFMDDEDQQDVMNQWAAKVDLDSRLREIGRQLFECSQVYVASLWAMQTYTVRGRTADGNKKRKKISFRAPTDIAVLDPLKIVPVGPTIFGREQLAWIATRPESARFNDILSDDHKASDDIVEKLVTQKYEPELAERKELAALGIDTNNLWLLNPQFVFRHTLTRPSFLRFAPIRMRRIFELLDLKQQLRQMERAHLIGGTNFIVLITKGSDKLPADPSEVAHLRAQVRTVSRTPVLVGDHRLHVEIVTPDTDNTLRAERFNTIDSRITSSLYGMFMLGNYAAGAAGDDSVKLVKVVAKGMESRRAMIRRTLEKYIFQPMADGNEELSEKPKLIFHPRAIALDFDSAWADFLLTLRESNEISRETILQQFDLDQSFEAKLIERERDQYDDIFMTQVPHGTPNPANPGQPTMPGPNGPRPLTKDNGGGKRNGGGRAPGSGQGQPARRPTKKSDNGKKAKVAAGMTVQIVDADGNLVQQLPLDAILAMVQHDEGGSDAAEPEAGD